MKHLLMAMFLPVASLSSLFAGDASPTDTLMSLKNEMGEAARQRQSHPPLPGEFPEDTRLRYARKEAEKALLAALVPNTVRLNKDVSWNLNEGLTIAARAGDLLSFMEVKNGNYIIRYKNYELSLPLAYGSPSAPDPTAVAAARDRIKLLNEEEQTRMLKKQLSEMNQTLRELRDLANERW